METLKIQTVKTPSNVALWAGRIIGGIVILFLLFDSIMKVIRESHYVEGSAKLGLSDSTVQPIGIVLLAFTILYIIPRTAIFGAILLTAYLGAATSTMIIAGEPFFFPIGFAIFVWIALYLKDSRLRSIVPLRREE